MTAFSLRSFSLAASFCTLAMTPATASGDDLVAGYGEFAFGGPRIDGDLGKELDGGLLGFRLGAGLRWQRYSLGLAFDMSFFEGVDVYVHGRELIWLGLGPEFRVYGGGETGFRPYARLGLRRAWLNGSQAVLRTCSQTGTCAGGFWKEKPDYDGRSALVSIGFEFMIPPAARKGGLLAVQVDLAVERASVDILGTDTRGYMTRLSIGMAFGGGRLVTKRPQPAKPRPTFMELMSQ